MSKAVGHERLWGGETEKAVANFPVSGEPIPAPVARWLGRIKAAAARVNAELELLDARAALSEASLKEIDALVSFHSSLASLEGLTGSALVLSRRDK